MRFSSKTTGIVLLVAAAILVLVFAARAPFRRPASPYKKITVEPTLTVYMHETGETEEMPMEQYLLGVVAGEMDPNWPLEALKAQAILARTFTVEALQRKGGTRDVTGTDVTTDETKFQAYNASEISGLVRQAVAETRGHLIVTGSGDPIRAWFHSDAGGKTATALEGLAFRDAPTPYIKVADAPSDNPDPDWQATFSIAELQAAVRKVNPGAGAFTAAEVSIAAKGPSGRATEIQAGGLRVSAPALRTALDPRRMKSTMLTSITASGDQVTMAGKGSGHGVGLPQWSAHYLASRGEIAAAILYRFFDSVRVEQWWK